jgi:hypothetical protein
MSDLCKNFLLRILICITIFCRAVDPESDPAFQVNPDPDTDPIRIQVFDDQKLKKKIQQKFV